MLVKLYLVVKGLLDRRISLVLVLVELVRLGLSSNVKGKFDLKLLDPIRCLFSCIGRISMFGRLYV